MDSAYNIFINNARMLADRRRDFNINGDKFLEETAEFQMALMKSRNKGMTDYYDLFDEACDVINAIILYLMANGLFNEKDLINHMNDKVIKGLRTVEGYDGGITL